MAKKTPLLNKPPVKPKNTLSSMQKKGLRKVTKGMTVSTNF